MAKKKKKKKKKKGLEMSFLALHREGKQAKSDIHSLFETFYSILISFHPIVCFRIFLVHFVVHVKKALLKPFCISFLV